MDLRSFCIILTGDCPEVGGVAGDSVLIRPGDSDPIVVVHRPAHATYGELAGVLADGRGECPTLPSSLALQRLVSLAQSTAPPPPRPLAFSRSRGRLA